MLDLVCGFDPGVVNVGLAFVNRETLVAESVNLVNLMINGEFVYDFQSRDHGNMIVRWVQHFDAQFRRTSEFAIEMQPNNVHRTVNRLAGMFEQTVRLTYPHIRMRTVDSRRVRSYFGSRGSTYSVRKSASMQTGMLGSKRHYALVRQAFTVTKRGRKGRVRRKFCVDAVEACAIAAYAITNPNFEYPPLRARRALQPGVVSVKRLRLYLPGETAGSAAAAAPPNSALKRARERAVAVPAAPAAVVDLAQDSDSE